MARDSERTRTALIDAAERLFAANGIDRVSMREISRASGARNAVALQYHFSDRQGIVRAVLSKHIPDVEKQRHRLLDTFESQERPVLRDLSRALVLPSAAKLSDTAGGPEFLQISAELLNRPVGPITPGPSSSSIERWRGLVEPYLEADAVRLHRRFTAIRFCALELGQRAHTGPHRDDRLFASQLVDLVTALLLAPVSSDTAVLAGQRGRPTDST